LATIEGFVDKEDQSSADMGFPLGLHRSQLASLPAHARTMTPPTLPTKIHVRGVGGMVMRAGGTELQDEELGGGDGGFMDNTAVWEEAEESRMMLSCITLAQAWVLLISIMPRWIPYYIIHVLILVVRAFSPLYHASLDSLVHRPRSK